MVQSVVCPLSVYLQEFQERLDEVQASGETALWKAVHEGVDQLEQYRAQQEALARAVGIAQPPEINLRILAMTDGTDSETQGDWNKEKHKMADLARTLRHKGIVLDCLNLGAANNHPNVFNLDALAIFSGGVSFRPESTLEMMTYFEVWCSPHFADICN